jgi:uncharacterized protein YqgC (DUF456 family)
MAAILLIGAIVLGLLMIPLGLPGTLIIFAATLMYYLLVPAGPIGLATVVGIGVLMAIAEILEFMLAGQYAKKYGGSKRAGWGAILGGIVGAFMGVPIPIIGSVIGAFIGSFVGAFAFEWWGHKDHNVATRVAWGALVGRAVSAAMKVGIGLGMAVWLVGMLILG